MLTLVGIASCRFYSNNNYHKGFHKSTAFLQHLHTLAAVLLLTSLRVVFRVAVTEKRPHGPANSFCETWVGRKLVCLAKLRGQRRPPIVFHKLIQRVDGLGLCPVPAQLRALPGTVLSFRLPNMAGKCHRARQIPILLVFLLRRTAPVFSQKSFQTLDAAFPVPLFRRHILGETGPAELGLTRGPCAASHSPTGRQAIFGPKFFCQGKPPMRLYKPLKRLEY